MRQLRLLSVLTAVVALLCGCATQVMSTALVSAQTTRLQAVPAAPAGWTTVFKDDFAGRAGSAPSAKNWFYDIGTGYGTGEIEHTTRSTRNVYLDGHGHLVLKATRSGGTWWSGRIESTRDDFAAPPGGQLELTASVKQPRPANGLGYWPAFWALGSPMRKGGGWPASGELDMMEDVNGLNQASQTLHDAAGSSGHPLIPCRGSRCESGYHTYSVIINRTNTRAEFLRFLMDGRVTDTITEAEVGATAWHKAIDHGFFIIFDLAMGGNYPDGECNCTTPTSATTPGAAMSVAYVAAYEKHAPAKTTTAAAASPGSGAPPASFWGNTRNIPAAKQVLEVEVINRTNGHVRNSGIYWSFDGTEKSIAQQHYIDMPANSSGRMYFYLGSKTSKYYDFIEFTVGSGFINVDTTRVDRFGLKLALLVHSHSGSTEEIGENYATFRESRAATFRRFKDFVPAPFRELATIDAPYGIPSPGNDPSFQPGGTYAAYFTTYAGAHGAKGVTTAQVFGCGGALSANPPLCAALNRHVAQLPVAAQSNPASFYKAAPANYYAAFWHRNAINGKQYGFPYDDDANQSSDISVSRPAYMIIAVGW